MACWTIAKIVRLPPKTADDGRYGVHRKRRGARKNAMRLSACSRFDAEPQIRRKIKKNQETKKGFLFDACFTRRDRRLKDRWSSRLYCQETRVVWVLPAERKRRYTRGTRRNFVPPPWPTGNGGLGQSLFGLQAAQHRRAPHAPADFSDQCDPRSPGARRCRARVGKCKEKGDLL